MRISGWTLLAAMVALTPATGVHAQTYGIGTLPQGSLGYSIAAGIAKVASTSGGLDVRAIGQGGSSVYLPQVNKNEIAFGTSNTFESIFAHNGTGNFEGRPNPNIRVVATLVPFSVGVMVRADSDINEMTDLKGRPFPTGYSAQRLVGIMQNAILGAVGVNESDLKPVPVPNFAKGAELLAQGSVAGVLLAPGSGVVDKTNAAARVKFLSVPDRPEVVAAIQKDLPSTYLAQVSPNPRMPYITAPVNLVGYQYTLVAGKDVPDDVVYKVAKALYENKKALADTHGVFRQFDPEAMAATLSGIAYHPGAAKFYKEAKIWRGN